MLITRQAMVALVIVDFTSILWMFALRRVQGGFAGGCHMWDVGFTTFGTWCCAADVGGRR